MFTNILEFNQLFGTERKCLEYLLRIGHRRCSVCGKRTFYRIKGRRSYACSCGTHLSPTAGTIFHKSTTPLRSWFYAIYLFGMAKNGLSAAELTRQLGVSYNTAWRMLKLIRSLTDQAYEEPYLPGVIEMDETYIGGKVRKRVANGFETKKKAPVIGMVSRDGKVRAIHAPKAGTREALGMVRKYATKGTMLITDESNIYRWVRREGYKHKVIQHLKFNYVRGKVHTNGIEGFWSQVKRSLSGTYVSVSTKYLQSYLDERAFHYNHRDASGNFHLLLARASQ